MRHLLIILGIISFNCNSTGKVKELHFILPNDFNGNTLIIYNKANGIKPEKDNSNIIYKLDQSGVLLLNEDRKTGFYKMRYFIEGDGNVREIFDLKPSDMKKNSLFVSRHHSGSVECKGSENVKYSTFFVGTKEMSEMDFIKKDSLIDNFVKCSR